MEQLTFYKLFTLSTRLARMAAEEGMLFTMTINADGSVYMSLVPEGGQLDEEYEMTEESEEKSK